MHHCITWVRVDNGASVAVVMAMSINTTATPHYHENQAKILKHAFGEICPVRSTTSLYTTAQGASMIAQENISILVNYSVKLIHVVHYYNLSYKNQTKALFLTHKQSYMTYVTDCTIGRTYCIRSGMSPVALMGVTSWGQYYSGTPLKAAQ